MTLVEGIETFSADGMRLSLAVRKLPVSVLATRIDIFFHFPGRWRCSGGRELRVQHGRCSNPSAVQSH